MSHGRNRWSHWGNNEGESVLKGGVKIRLNEIVKIEKKIAAVWESI